MEYVKQTLVYGHGITTTIVCAPSFYYLEIAVDIYQFSVSGSTKVQKPICEIIHAFDALDAMEEFTKEYPQCDIQNVSIFNGTCWSTVYGLEHINPSLLNEQAH